jgi:hypothetical protein
VFTIGLATSHRSRSASCRRKRREISSFRISRYLNMTVAYGCSALPYRSSLARSDSVGPAASSRLTDTALSELVGRWLLGADATLPTSTRWFVSQPPNAPGIAAYLGAPHLTRRPARAPQLSAALCSTAGSGNAAGGPIRLNCACNVLTDRFTTSLAVRPKLSNFGDAHRRRRSG